MSKVYVDTFQTRFSLEKAKEYGDLIEVVTRTPSPHNTAGVARQAVRVLSKITRDDYLLLVGHSVVSSLVTAVALRITHGYIKALVWKNSTVGYTVIELHLEREMINVRPYETPRVREARTIVTIGSRTDISRS